jgi:hypothetical protein
MRLGELKTWRLPKVLQDTRRVISSVTDIIGALTENFRIPFVILTQLLRVQ